ncbi:helix-turn-helix transcriptional regulator [Actinokineospora sp. UTMC 2448]|uniref:helix-turn-helix domain-containing protein n=1 Tax=Actinokineospora sp. UTMC 2448 TaxID=2268449 RepID=UPI00216494C4|nr:helix-turn-helix transcriptional regulator [Actinokineospora sp. UTMC 2448]UVS80773.1 putative ATPase [Actinokineospora sp. UTMC 2448]
MDNLGAMLRAARVAAGVSLSAMAERTHYSKPYLGQLETGKRMIKPEHVTAYARALDVPESALYGPMGDPLRAAHEWLVSDSPAKAHLDSGRRVGAELATALETRVVRLRNLDDVIGGRELFPLVRNELLDAQQTIQTAAYDARTSRRLLTVVGELAQLAGWVASDAGRYREAQRVYLSGVSAAREAGDDVLVAQLLSCLSYQIANVGNPVDAALLARTAAAGARRATPVVRALLWERVAWASARSRDREGTRRALDAVDDVYERRSPSIEEPEWVYWVNRDEIAVMAGRCMVELGDPRNAAPLLSAVIEKYPAEHVRERALYMSWLAESYARAGDRGAANEVIARARALADSAQSTRLDARVDHVHLLVSDHER